MITTFYPPYHFGGDAIQIYRLANALAKRGHSVHVIHCEDAYRSLSSEPNIHYENHSNVVIHRLKSTAGILSPLLSQQTGYPFFKTNTIKKILQREQFDVIHFHNISLLGPAVLKLGTATKLFTIHEHWLICPMHVLWKFNREVCERKQCFTCQIVGRRPPQWWRYTSLLSDSIRSLHRVLSPSQFTIRKHQEYGLDLPYEHLPHFLPDSPQQETLSPLNRPYFFYAGRLEKLKGPQFLVGAFRKYRDADLVIAGRGDYLMELKKLAAGCDHIHFLGLLQPAELDRYYKHAIAVLVPSLCYEVFGLVIVEAFRQKTPVIAHRLGALEEILTESGGGFCYQNEEEFLEQLAQLQSQPELRKTLGEKGYRSYQEKWTEEVHLEQYFRILENCSHFT